MNYFALDKNESSECGYGTEKFQTLERFFTRKPRFNCLNFPF